MNIIVGTLSVDRSVFTKTDKEKATLASLKAAYKAKMRKTVKGWTAKSAYYSQKAHIC